MSAVTLTTGPYLTRIQTHSWRETAEGHWTGVMRGRVWTLTQTDDTLWYHVYDERKCGTRKRTGDSSEQKLKEFVKEEEDGEEEEQLKDYFQLNVKLETLYTEWGAADPHFKKIANIFTGQCTLVITEQ